jgi:sugar (glycoside-pentoside-hexuronide) transporter
MRKAKTSEILKYGFGGLGSNIPFLLMMMYSMFFYTNILGISPAIVGTIFLSARLIDAFTDPLMGMLADKTKSKIGRYRPWIKYMAPFVGLGTFLVFASPAFSPTGKVIYAFITYIFYSLVSTAVNIPYHSLTAQLSDDPEQRTTIAVVKQSFIIPAMIVGSILVLPLVNVLGGGATAWAIYGALAGILTTIAFWICQTGAKEHDKNELYDTTHTTNKISTEDLKLIFKNQPLMMLVIAFGTDMIAFSAASAVNVYFFIYYLGREDLVALVAMMQLIGMLIVFPLLTPITRKFGKKNVYLVNTLLLTFLFLIWFFVGPNSIPLHMILAFATTTLALLPGTLGWSMIADCVDYAEWKFRKRAAGTVTSLLPFINKLGMAIGGGFVGYFIASAGYEASLDVQSDSALLAIRQVKFLLPVLGYVASLISMYFYKLNNTTMMEMKTALSNVNS